MLDGVLSKIKIVTCERKFYYSIMTWKIFDKPTNGSVLNLDFSIKPPNDVLWVVITGIFAYRYVEMVDNLAKDIGYYEEFLAVNLYSEMDWEDRARAKGMQEDEVQLFLEFNGVSYVKEAFFCRVVYDYASKLLTVYRNHEEIQADYTRWLIRKQAPDNTLRQYFLHFNSNWTIAMEEGLLQLKKKIDSRWGLNGNNSLEELGGILK
jgi:hypothetical protein